MQTIIHKPLAGEGHGVQPDGPASGSLLTPPPALSRCESCRIRPFEVIDSRFGEPAFGVCTTCFDGVMA